MSCKQAHGAVWLRFLHVPELNAAILAPTGQKPSITTPGQRVHWATLFRKRLQLDACRGVPEGNRCISSADQRVSIGCEGEAPNAARMFPRPEERSILQIPHFDR